MNKLMMVASAAMIGAMVTGCAAWKEMQEKQAKEEAAQKAERAEKGPVRYWLEKKASPECIAKADQLKPFDPDFREAVEYSVTSYKSEVANLQKLMVVQDGVAVWERARAEQSEKVQKEIKDFTAADEQAAYALVTDPKEKQALDAYLKWGSTLDAQAIEAARQRNDAFLKSVLKYTTQAKKIAEKFKSNKMKYATAVSDGLNALNYLSLAGEAATIEADAMAAAKAASGHLQDVAK